MSTCLLLAWLACLLAACRASSSFPLMALPPVARRQMEMPPPSAEREPSCMELRSMWRHMRRMGRQMEFTNEIPKLQDPFTASAVRYGAARRRPSKYPDPNPYSAAKSSIAAKESAYRQQQNARNEVVQYAPPPEALGFHEFDDRPPKAPMAAARIVPGRFADASLPEESLGVYGTVVHSPEERAKFRARTRRPPDFGMSRYRGTWSDSTGLGRVPFRPPKPHNQYDYGVVTHGNRGGYPEFPQEVGQRNGGGVRVERIDKIALGKLKNSCLRLHNKSCRTDIDCYCNGNPKLFCGAGRCRPLFKAAKYGKQKWGKSWLTDPYERSLLGYGPKRDPVWPGPF